jgi:hypothetical protein
MFGFKKPRVITTTCNIFYVRTGDYDIRSGEINALGEIQAATAAQSIADRYNPEIPIGVIDEIDPFTLHRRQSYLSTARIIAARFGIVPCITSDEVEELRFNQPCLSLGVARNLYRAQMQYVEVIDGTSLGRLLGIYDGPLVRFIDDLPELGTAHELTTTFNAVTGKVLDRRFI